jgi:hypothetical protein
MPASVRVRFLSRRVFVAFLTLLLLPAIGYAQEATITGTITDSTGAVLPGVTVTAVNEATGNMLESVTDERGGFRMPARIGNYRLTASLAGFNDIIRTAVPVAVGQTVVINLQLAPTGLSETVNVTAETPLLDITNSSLGTNISQAQMEELPVNGRNWQDLAMLAVGNKVNEVGTNEIAAQGAGTYQVNIDGQEVTYQGGGLGNVQARFSRDAIAEFEYIANRFDASQGRSQGVQINAVTKGGTNQFQGSAGAYFRSDRFNAADHVLDEVLPYSNQQVSFTHGGPIIRDRFHYFANYEFEQQDFSTVFTTPYPAFNLTFTEPRQEHKSGLRLDYQFNPNFRASLRGAMWQNDQQLDQGFKGSSTDHPSFLVHTYRDSDQLQLTLTQVIGNAAVNEIRSGYSGLRNREQSRVPWPQHPAAQTDGIVNGSPILTFNGMRFGPPGSVPQEIQQGNLSLRDDFTFSYNAKGRHDLKVGADYVKNSFWLLICRDCTGIYDMQGGPIPANFAAQFPVWDNPETWNLDAFLPITRRYTQGIGDFTFSVDRHQMAGWVQDDWKVGSKLTLNLGLRYDLQLNAFGENFTFDPWVQAGRPTDTNNWGPRLGAAYQLDDRTVIRGGWGKYYSWVSDQSAHGTVSWVNIVGVELLPDGRPDFNSNPFNGPQPTYAQLVPRTCWDQKVNQGGARPGCIRRTVGNNLSSPESQFPYSYQASVGFQRQIGSAMAFEADYVYYKSYYNIAGGNINLSWNPATGLPYPTNQLNRLPFPEWGTVSMLRNSRGEDEKDHTIQMGFQKRFSNNWQASATYSMSFNYNKLYPVILPEMTAFPQTAGGCSAPVTWNATFTEWNCHTPVNFAAFGVDVYNNQEWFRSNRQVHRAVFNAIYQLPYDINLSGLYFYGDNGFLTTTSGVDIFNVGGVIANRTRADGSIIPLRNFDKKDLHRVDLRVTKVFSLGRSVSVEPMLEVFNLFNRANFTDYVVNESNARFGEPEPPTQISYQPRVIQLGFRAKF